MLSGTLCEMLDSVSQRSIAFHCRQRVCASRKALADTPFGAKILVGEPGGTTAVHTLHIAAKDEHFVLA